LSFKNLLFAFSYCHHSRSPNKAQKFATSYLFEDKVRVLFDFYENEFFSLSKVYKIQTLHPKM